MAEQVTPLHLLRRERELSLEALARKAGVSFQTVRRADRGETQPHWRTRRRLAEALGVPEHELWPHLVENAA